MTVLINVLVILTMGIISVDEGKWCAKRSVHERVVQSVITLLQVCGALYPRWQ